MTKRNINRVTIHDLNVAIRWLSYRTASIPDAKSCNLVAAFLIRERDVRVLEFEARWFAKQEKISYRQALVKIRRVKNV